MKTLELKKLIKEAVREVLKEELAELGKQKINESLTSGGHTGGTAWPTMNFTSDNIAQGASRENIRQSLMDQMGMTPPPVAAPTTFSEKQNVYQNMLAQVANEMRQNPAEISNFRNIQ